jgi:hypothetical protein
VNRDEIPVEYAWLGWVLVLAGFYLMYLYYEKGGHKLWFPFGAITPF